MPCWPLERVFFFVQIALLGMRQWSSRLGMVIFVDNRGVISLEVLLEYHNVGQGVQKLTLGSSSSCCVWCTWWYMAYQGIKNDLSLDSGVLLRQTLLLG